MEAICDDIISSILEPCIDVIRQTPALKHCSIAGMSVFLPISSVIITWGAIDLIKIDMPYDLSQPSSTSTRGPRLKLDLDSCIPAISERSSHIATFIFLRLNCLAISLNNVVLPHPGGEITSVFTGRLFFNNCGIIGIQQPTISFANLIFNELISLINVGLSLFMTAFPQFLYTD